MAYYDLHLHSASPNSASSLKEMAKSAKLLGYKGICFSEYFKSKNMINELKEKIKETGKGIKIKIFLGFEARNAFELKRLVSARREYDVLLARGHDLSFSRMAVETPEVDMLTHPEFERRDSGLNHVMAKLAKENNVAIEINFRELLLSSKSTTSLIMHNMANNVKLCKKYNAPIIICSGAISPWQLRDPKVLISMGCLLGLNIRTAKDALSKVPESIIRQAKERQSEKWIMPGVKEV